MDTQSAEGDGQKALETSTTTEAMHENLTQDASRSSGQVETEIPQTLDAEDDLEEGELKDDDDDDDELDEVDPRKSDSEDPKDSSSSKSSSEDEGENHKKDAEDPKSGSSSGSDEKKSQSKQRTRSSSSSSSMSALSKEISSKSSSRIGSHHSPHARSSSSNHDLISSKRLSICRSNLNDRFRSSRDKDRQDPSEKAAKLISMRTKLLEARSREIEMKLNKNRNVLVPTQRPTLIGAQRFVKMTMAKPIISYSENPNPPPLTITPVEASKKIKAKKSEEKLKKLKKKTKKKSKKKKKKHSPKKHKKHKGHDSSVKVPSQSKEETLRELVPPYQTTDHQGPRTPPDNHVLTLEDKQIEWPSHLIRMTTTLPSISYSVNPRSLLEPAKEERDCRLDKKQKKSTNSINGKRKRKKDSDSLSSSSSSSSSSTTSSSSTSSSSSSETSSFQYNSRMQGKTSANSHLPSKPRVYTTDLNADYNWYCDYFIKSYDMNLQQAQHVAYIAIVSGGTYKDADLDHWLRQRGMSRDVSDGSSSQKLYPFSLGSSVDDSSKFIKGDSSENYVHEVDNHGNSTDNVGDITQIQTIATRITRNQVNRDVVEPQEIKQEPSADETEQDSNSGSHGQEDQANKAELDSKMESTPDTPKSSFVCNSIKLNPVEPKFVVIKTDRDIILPNGQVLPPGTIQKIVHPYPKLDSEVLGPFCDLY